MQKSGRSEQSITIPAGHLSLCGNLHAREGMSGIVLFAHGSGSGRHSPRNRYVAKVLQDAGLGTLLLELLTQEEEQIDEQTRHLRFDIGMLADRLVSATDWIVNNLGNPGVGYFGASTGAAAALVAAGDRQRTVKAIVSRGGRPDLAGAHLEQVKAPTLLIVGGDDEPVIQMNREALESLRVEKDLVIVPGATHLFEELGKLEQVAGLASDWFVRFLGKEHGNVEAERRDRP